MFLGGDLSHVGVWGIFYAGYSRSLKVLTFFGQLADALALRFGHLRQPNGIARLSRRIRSHIVARRNLEVARFRLIECGLRRPFDLRRAFTAGLSSCADRL